MKKVLLVDDDVVFNFLHRRLLEISSLSHDVHVALNGKGALDFISSQPRDATPDVILLDLSMPVMDGFEFIRAFRLTGDARTRIIVVTSSENPKDVTRLEDLGITEIFRKPVSLEQLKHVLA